jgi:hypothetical protein
VRSYSLQSYRKSIVGSKTFLGISAKILPPRPPHAERWTAERIRAEGEAARRRPARGVDPFAVQRWPPPALSNELPDSRKDLVAHGSGLGVSEAENSFAVAGFEEHGPADLLPADALRGGLPVDDRTGEPGAFGDLRRPVAPAVAHFLGSNPSRLRYE